MINRPDRRRKAFSLFFIFMLALSLALPASSPVSAEPGQKSFFWKVRARTGVVYLLGSVHAFRKELYPLPQRIEEAFDESDTLVVEANINEMNLDSLVGMIEGAFYPEGDSLEKHLSSGTYELAKARLAASGMPIELFQRNKPWLVALMLSVLEMQKLGLDPAYGIDRHFLDKAGSRKRIVELESVDFQFRLLNSFSDPEQDLFLLYTLKDMDVFAHEMETMIKAWTAGDTGTMESVVTKSADEDPRLTAVLEKLLYGRNRSMALKIDGFLRSGGKYFVVVGAGHLVGKKGIPALLRDKGYTVEQQ